uniref:Uncharacterized protein n=1 Tax=Candidatus Nitrotoga fabula TaxID=2182327 RepID=A0A2X0QW63_9PROT|nr:protein of unknown function [Candidatus Nitrotoga fabula]
MTDGVSLQAADIHPLDIRSSMDAVGNEYSEQLFVMMCLDNYIDKNFKYLAFKY